MVSYLHNYTKEMLIVFMRKLTASVGLILKIGNVFVSSRMYK